MKQFINEKAKEIKLEIVGYSDYVVADNAVYNRKTQRKIKRVLKNGMIGYYLNGKFINRKNLKYQRPKDFDCPF